MTLALALIHLEVESHSATGVNPGEIPKARENVIKVWRGNMTIVES
jgi:hypothetical protein